MDYIPHSLKQDWIFRFVSLVVLDLPGGVNSYGSVMEGEQQQLLVCLFFFNKIDW